MADRRDAANGETDPLLDKGSVCFYQVKAHCLLDFVQVNPVRAGGDHQHRAAAILVLENQRFSDLGHHAADTVCGLL